jgi:hypothetical protein
MQVHPAARKPLLILIAAGLLVIGGLGLAQAVRDATAMSHLRDGGGSVVEGEVSAIVQQPGGSGSGANRRYTFCPEYRFETTSGETYRVEVAGSCGSNVDDFALGSTAELIYDESDPTIVYLNEASNPVVGVLLSVASLLGRVVIVGFLVRGMRSRTATRKR